MKKLKYLSALLAVLMLLSVIPFGSMTVSAETTLPAMPTTYPTTANASELNPIGKTNVLADFGERMTTVAGGDAGGSAIENGKYVTKIKDKYQWPQGGLTTTSTVGVKGIMVYIETASGQSKVDFIINIMLGLKRTNNSGASSDVRAWTAPKNSGKTTYAYYYNPTTASWSQFTQNTNGYYLTSPAGTGWYYIPFDSFICTGAAGQNNANDPLVYMTLTEVMAHSPNMKIGGIQLKSNTVGQAFNDVHLVYESDAAAPATAAERSLLPDFKYNSTEGAASVKGENKGSVLADGSFTVTGMTGNSASASGNRVWFYTTSSTKTDLTKASGIKFYVDTTALGSARLNLSLRLQDQKGPKNFTDYMIAENGSLAYAASTVGSLVQYSLFSAGSVAYYFDANGDAQPLYPNAGVTSLTREADKLDALPAGYKGYIYIPMSSFYASMGGSYNSQPMVSFEQGAAAGLFKNVQGFTICHSYTGTPAVEEVTYSDFTAVYDEISVSSASVTLENDLSMNFVTKVDGNVSEFAYSFVMNDVTKQSAKNTVTGGFELVCQNILPQNVADTVKLTVSGKVGGVAVSTTVETSVKEYCVKLLATTTDAKTKAIAADLLKYAAAAQNLADYKTSALATAGVNLTGLGATVNKDAITAQYALTGTADAAYAPLSAALRLEGKLGLKIKFTAATTENLTVTVTVNGRVNTYGVDALTTVEGAANTYTVVCNDFDASEMDATVTVALSVGGEAKGQTLTYSVADYVKTALNDTTLSINEQAMVEALYAYGLSAAAYADAQ